MERLISRLSWNNLPIRFKTGLVFVLQITLIMGMAVAGFVSLDTVRVVVETTLTKVVEARSLARELGLQVEGLEQARVNLATSSAEPGFDPAQSNALSVFGNQVLDIKTSIGDLQVLRTLLSGAVPDEVTSATFSEFNQNLDVSQQHFLEMHQISQQLNNPVDGALPGLRAGGEELQDLALLAGDATLVSKGAFIRSLEASFITNYSPESERALENALQDWGNSFRAVAPEEIQARGDQATAAYAEQIENSARLLRQFEGATGETRLSIAALRDASARLSNIIEAQTRSPLDTVAAILNQARVTLVIGLLAALVAGAFVTLLFSRAMARAMGELVASAQQLETGNFRARAAVRGQDEFSQIGGALNAMAIQIEGLISGLEQRVAERTRDLSITADIGRAVVQLRDSRELMNEIVELIRQRFGYYHAQIFLLDDSRERAVLVASTGMAGRELLSRGHSLEVGSQSVIGQVTSKGAPVIATDTDVSGIHKRNELLPDTRSEMALPMRIGDRVFGALDVQSVAPNAFPEDVVAVFQTMADQLATALENARIYNQLQDARAQLEMLERGQVREAWRSYEQARSADAPAAFAFGDGEVQPHAGASPFAVQEALTSGQAIALGNGDETSELAVPIKVRGEVIGALGFSGESLQNLSEDDIALVEAVIDRVGLALENIRLVEQTSRRAEHEQIVNEITAKIVGSTDVNFILQTTVKELGRVLRAPQTSVQLRRDTTE